MFNVSSVEETLKLIDEKFSEYSLESERIDITQAVGRITSEDIYSKEDVPGFNRSLVDGYAVYSQDTNGASEAIPAQLIFAGEVKMGEKPQLKLERGQAVYVPTGGEIPQGADAMVMIEYTENLEDGFIYIEKAAAPGNHIVFKGDDTRIQQKVISKNHVLRPQDIGALAALGYRNVPVKAKLKVGIVSTGDELVDIEEQTEGSKVRDVNTYALNAEIISFGAKPVLYGIIRDGYEKVKQAVEKAVSECDVVLISGGSSVGQKDETYNVIRSLEEAEMLIHGIAVKPGKPTILAKAGRKAIIGLPGHPVSAYFIYKIIVSHILNVMSGINKGPKPYINASIVGNYPSNNGREEYLPVRLVKGNEGFFAYPVFGKSGLITILALASGYVRIKRGQEGLSAGQKVEVTIF